MQKTGSFRLHGSRRADELLPKLLSCSNLMVLSIDKCPSSVNDCSEFGHHEMAAVVALPDSNATLLVLTKRLSRFD